MGQAIFSVLVVGVFVAIFTGAWPYLLGIAGLALGGWLLVGLLNMSGHRTHVAAAKRSAIAARADGQHQKIMAGDEEGGTFGNYPPAELDRPPTTVAIDEPDPTVGAVVPEVAVVRRPSKAVIETGRLEVDFVGRTFRYTDSSGTERKAAFPKGRDEYDLRNDPTLDDLARLLASSRGWSNAGGQNEWWQLTFDDYMTRDETLGYDVPNSLNLELTGHNPRNDFKSYVSFRGNDTLWGYGCAGGREEERLSFIGRGISALMYLYGSVMKGLEDAEDKGYFGNADIMLMRVIYRETGANEFEIRMPCQFEKPREWTPDWK